MKTKDLNDQRDWDRLSAQQQATLVQWIRDVLMPASRVFSQTSYGMKHDFENEPDGFYVTNGMFKGAMLAAGHCPVDESDLNWRFRVRPVRELTREEKRARNLIGRGWLVRSSVLKGVDA